MAFKLATVKRTSIVSCARKALSSVRSYIDVTTKNKGKDLSELGVGIGKNYFETGSRNVSVT
jgi:hypothetical protein